MKYLVSTQLMLLIAMSCGQGDSPKFDQLTEAEKRLPENAVFGLEVHQGLKVGLMASEPMLLNPTNIDVDDRSRVWVNEAYNYRPALNGNPATDEGDRILILEDTDGDGELDKRTVFYQEPELNAPLGICVLGNRVIVSQSPYVWDFYDDDGDGSADRKVVLIEGFVGEHHEICIHAVTVVPLGIINYTHGYEY